MKGNIGRIIFLRLILACVLLPSFLVALPCRALAAEECKERLKIVAACDDKAWIKSADSAQCKTKCAEEGSAVEGFRIERTVDGRVTLVDAKVLGECTIKPEDTVKSPRGKYVRLVSSNGNEILIEGAELFIIKVTGEGEMYYQRTGNVLYSVIHRMFFNVTTGRQSAAARGTEFSVNVDEENKKTLFEVEKGEIAVTSEFSIKVGDEQITHIVIGSAPQRPVRIASCCGSRSPQSH
jgi:hypothetical protein